MPGRPPKPNNVKKLRGTDEPRALRDEVEFEAVSEVPPAPDWLPNAHAVKEWDRLAPILHAAGLLTEAGLSAMGQLCALHGKVVQLYAAGESPNANMVSQLRAFINDFGLTPVAQGKVGNVGGKDKGNKFAARKKA
jgi:phage terminase small subunit